jgi:hypothetical protein
MPFVDLVARDERVDFDGVFAVDQKGVEFVVVHRDVGVLGVLVAAALIVALDRLAGDLVDQLLAQSLSLTKLRDDARRGSDRAPHEGGAGGLGIVPAIKEKAKSSDGPFTGSHVPYKSLVELPSPDRPR